MAVDPVPYVVHGAKHSADVFRQAHYDSMGGAHGISSVGALHVKQTGTPSNQVQVAPGGATILNTYSGGAGQVYSLRNASTTLIDVPASDSTGAKSWWIIAAIEDPQFGGQAPADPLVGPYAFLRCVAKNSAISYPHELLAEIVVPASTATVTNAMITSLREVARPRSEREWRSHSLLAEDTETLSSSLETGVTWPGAAEDAWQFMKVPEYATRARVRMMWLGVRTPGANVWGHAWVQLGYTNNPDHRLTQKIMYNTTNATDSARLNIIVSDDIYIPKALRGGMHKVYPRANRLGGASGANVSLDGLTAMDLEVEFMERPDDS